MARRGQARCEITMCLKGVPAESVDQDDHGMLGITDLE
jgi:hypothetical protein